MTPIPEVPLPDLVVAADWGVGWEKRWMARAVREKGSTSYTLSRADGLDIALTPSAEEWGEAGFASSDDFDPMLRVVGMLRTLRTEPSLEPPDEPRVRKVEGWILGPPRPESSGSRRKILPR
jgi:hypothetical protein